MVLLFDVLPRHFWPSKPIAKLRQLFATFSEAQFSVIAFSGVFVTILFPAWALQAQRSTYKAQQNLIFTLCVIEIATNVEYLASWKVVIYINSLLALITNIFVLTKCKVYQYWPSSECKNTILSSFVFQSRFYVII